jgi:PAS domain-containing protein
VTALIFLLKGWRRALNRDSKFLLLGLLAFIIFYSFCLVCEWSGITEVLDTAEDFIGALLPMWWAFLFYALLYEIASRDLRQSEERLHRVIQNMPVMMTAYDADRNIVAWNAKCERVTGYHAHEMIGNPKAMERLCPDPADRERVITG